MVLFSAFDDLDVIRASKMGVRAGSSKQRNTADISVFGVEYSGRAVDKIILFR
jgi:hypothetical protein